MRSPQSLLFSRLNKPNTLKPFFMREVHKPGYHLCGPLLDIPQLLCIFLVLEAPGLDALLQVGPHMGRANWHNHPPYPAGHPLSVHIRIQLAFQAASTHFWLMSNFSFIRTTKSFSIGDTVLLPTQSALTDSSQHSLHF